MATATQDPPATADTRPDTLTADSSPATPPAVRAPARGAAPARRRRAPTFDQFLIGQLPFLLALAVIFGAIAYAASARMPAGHPAGAAPAAQIVAGGAASTGPITAFSGGQPAAQQIAVAADPSGALKWDRATYEAQAGDVTFVVTNKSSNTHNFAVEGPDVKAQGPNFGPNTTTIHTIKGLKPGQYQIVCNFPGHKAAGMVAALIVK